MNRSFSVARAVALVGALVAFVAFFLPWVTYAQRSFSGADLATTLSPALAAVKAGGIKGLDLGLWAVALAAALAAIFILVSWVRAADPHEKRAIAFRDPYRGSSRRVAIDLPRVACLPLYRRSGETLTRSLSRKRRPPPGSRGRHFWKALMTRVSACWALWVNLPPPWKTFTPTVWCG